MNNSSIPALKSCENCGDTFSMGRIDKKYCTDACRIDYNNKIKLEKRISLPEMVRIIPRIILNNYRIMRKLNPGGTTKVSKEKLDALGFDFNYMTSYQTTKKGDTYHFCFDQGYLKLKDNMILLVVQHNQSD